MIVLNKLVKSKKTAKKDRKSYVATWMNRETKLKTVSTQAEIRIFGGLPPTTNGNFSSL